MFTELLTPQHYGKDRLDLTMISIPPFSLPGSWFKGCLHVHSTASDGNQTPQAVLDWYRSRGYHFLALTDHDVLSQGQAIADDFVTLSAAEVEGIDPSSGLYHLVGLGLHKPPDIGPHQVLPIQEAIRRLRAVDGRVIVAHPYWSGQMSKDLLDLDGCLALEIYNGGCEVDDGKGFSTVHWDDLWAAGRRLWGVAVDDAHWRHGDRDAGLGWVWVKALTLTSEAILEALERGHFYATSGPQILDLQIEAEQGQVQVWCSPAAAIDFIGNGWYSRRVSAPEGQSLSQASYSLRKDQRYLRVACQDAQGRWAWSNPIPLAPG